MNDGDQIVFFVDRALGKNHVANSLRNVGEAVEIHADYFSHDALDTDWLPTVAEKGWVVLTADQKIRYRHLELLAVEQFDCTLFCLMSGDLNGPDMAKAFVKAIKSIKNFVSHNPGPFIAKVYKDGRVQPWWS